MANEVENKSKVEKKATPNLKYMRDKDREPVKGIFHYYEVPGGVLEFQYRAYKEDPIEFYSLRDGQVYTLPLGVAKHLNKDCWYPEYEYYQGDPTMCKAFSDGQAVRVSRKTRRCGFQSLEFVDIDDIGETTTGLVEAKII